MLLSNVGKTPPVTLLCHRWLTHATVVLFILLVFVPEIAFAQDIVTNDHIAELCLAIADERDLPGGGEDHQDTLTQINRLTADSAIIGLTGTQNIEAMTFGPNHQIYVENNGFLGTVSLVDGTFTPYPQPLGTGGGVFGEISMRDVDALAYSLDLGLFFGARRRGGTALDLLFAIDPNTGTHIPNYFGPPGSETDYIPVAALIDANGDALGDVDDMQFNPVSGLLYATVNTDGAGGHIVTIDLETGIPTFVNTFRFADGTPQAGELINDIEGVSYFNDGTLYATTGNNFSNAPENRNRLFHIDPNTGIGTLVGNFPPGPKDFEALACLTQEAHIVLTKYTNGPGQLPDDADTPTGPTIQVGDTVTWTFTFTNTGVLTLTGLSLVDDKLGPIAPAVGQSCFTATTELAPGKSLTCTATGIATQGQYSNTATITGISVSGIPGLPPITVSDSNPSHYFGILSTVEAPAIEIRKYTNGEDANSPTGPVVPVGSVVTWTYEISNTGDVPLSNVVVTDDEPGVTPTYVSGDTNTNNLLEVGEIWYFQATGIAIEGQYDNVGTVTGISPGGQTVTDTDPSHYFGTTEPLGALGDRVWRDTNKNGIQDSGEAGVPGVRVDLFAGDGTFLATKTTDAQGNYLFSGLLAGTYYVEFDTPQGHSFTRYDVNGNSQDDADSDPLVPTVEVNIDDGGEFAQVGKLLTYTVAYTNTDPTLAAVDLTISTTIPVATSFVAAGSSPGWSCASEQAGSVCTINVGTVNANSNGTLTFVVLLDDDDAVVPGELVLLVGVTQATPGRTAVVTLGAGETNLSVDAGIVVQESELQTETSTGPTGLPPTQQPGQETELYLPSIGSGE